MQNVLAFIAQLGENPFEIAWNFLRFGGIFIFLIFAYYVVWIGWVNYVQGKFGEKRKFVLLAIDIPRLNEQSMKAVEQIIATLHGVHKGPNRKEMYWDGVGEDMFSLELVSIDGYIQYFVRCDDYNEDLVKGAFFAQYPDAEIIEVEDYVNTVPKKFPDEKMDMWGTEFVLSRPGMYPIKTYEHFEHSLTGLFADPMASILESLSRLRPGEQLWLQILITPVGPEWREDGVGEVNKLIGKSVPKKSRFGVIGKLPAEFLDEVRRQAFSTEDAPGAPSGGGTESNFSNLTSGEQMVVEEVQKKISRLAFATKFRMLYIAPSEVMHGARVIGAVFGAFKQFNTLDLNGFSPGRATTSSPSYVFVERRQTTKKNMILNAYRNRDMSIGDTEYPLSTTELATIFHFPVETVRAPLVSRTASKKSEPPTALPFENDSPFQSLRDEYSVVDIDGAGRGEPKESTVEEEVTEFPSEAPSVAAPRALVIPAPVAEPSASVNVPTEASYPLHSMQGLPPGVRPVAHQSQTQQFTAAHKQIPVTQGQAQATPQQRVVQPPDYFAPLNQRAQAQPVQQHAQPNQQVPPQQNRQPAQQPVQRQPKRQEAVPDQNGGIPTNLPIG